MNKKIISIGIMGLTLLNPIWSVNVTSSDLDLLDSKIQINKNSISELETDATKIETKFENLEEDFEDLEENFKDNYKLDFTNDDLKNLEEEIDENKVKIKQFEKEIEDFSSYDDSELKTSLKEVKTEFDDLIEIQNKKIADLEKEQRKIKTQGSAVATDETTETESSYGSVTELVDAKLKIRTQQKIENSIDEMLGESDSSSSNKISGSITYDDIKGKPNLNSYASKSLVNLLFVIVLGMWAFMYFKLYIPLHNPGKTQSVLPTKKFNQFFSKSSKVESPKQDEDLGMLPIVREIPEVKDENDSQESESSK